MTRDEMRMIRREWINHYLQNGVKSASYIAFCVRYAEFLQFGYELNLYR